MEGLVFAVVVAFVAFPMFGKMMGMGKMPIPSWLIAVVLFAAFLAGAR